MRVIEENQDKMLEGEYLEAMNALGALYRQEDQTRQAQAQAPAQAPAQQPEASQRVSVHSRMIQLFPHPPSYNASTHLFASPRYPPEMLDDRVEQSAWKRVQNNHPDPFVNRITPQQWIELTHDSRFRLLREATEYCVSKRETINNSNPSLCPFIARHSVGIWNIGDGHENEVWECVCGYTGKVKHWQKHEESERHQDWAKHRTVNRRKIKKMKDRISYDEEGLIVRFSYASPNSVYQGGIRYYTVTQEKNEWTHPEMFPEVYRNPTPTEDGVGRWFVYSRNVLAREYVN